MKDILIIGAGRSSTALINYILEQAKEHDFFVTVGDADVELAKNKIGNHPKGRAIWIDASKVNERRDVIRRHDVVVSLLPPQMHLEVAQDCIALGKHMVTASDVSKQVYRLGDEARQRALVFMNELGLDPGIDHMSAMQRIDSIKNKGGKLPLFTPTQGAWWHRNMMTIPGITSSLEPPQRGTCRSGNSAISGGPQVEIYSLSAFVPPIPLSGYPPSGQL